MEFYKLYYIVRRRTDYEQLFENIFRRCFPEIYKQKVAEKLARRHDALNHLAMMNALVAGLNKNMESYF